MRKIFPFMFLMLVLGYSGHAQNYKIRQGFMLSKEDRIDILTQRSKQQKTKGLIALISGPVITATGMANTLQQENDINQTTYNVGHLIAFTGVVTTISSLPLFVASINNKQRAKLLLKEEKIGFKMINKPAQVTALAVQLSL